MANYIGGPTDVIVDNTFRWNAYSDQNTNHYWSVTGTENTDWVEISQGNTSGFYDVKFLNTGTYTISDDLIDLQVVISIIVEVHPNLDKVPNTSDFTLQNVCNVVLNNLEGSLNNCFSIAESTYFNGSYSGSKDRLSNFRDYDPTSGGGGGATGVIDIPQSQILFAYNESGSGVAVTFTITANPSVTVNITPASNGTFSIFKTGNSVTVYPYSQNLDTDERGITITAYYENYTTDSINIRQEGRFLTD